MDPRLFVVILLLLVIIWYVGVDLTGLAAIGLTLIIVTFAYDNKLIKTGGSSEDSTSEFISRSSASMDAPTQSSQNLEPYLKLCPDGKTKYLVMNRHQVDAVGRNVVARWLSSHFPDKSYWITPLNIKNMLGNLKAYKPIFSSKPFVLPNLDLEPKNIVYGDDGIANSAKPCLLLNDPHFYESMNLLPEAFMDLERVRVKRVDQSASPLDIYTTDIVKMMNTCLSKRREINAHNLRETVYESTFEATEFKPSVLAALIHKFKPKRVLDFCAGRGSRLVACIAKEVDYTGVDPDAALHPIYQRMIEVLTSESTNKNTYRMIQAKAQDLELPKDDMYEMIMTSPPYFDLEIYSEDPEQSVMEFPEVKDWLEKFLLASIKKSLAHLKSGGHMIININDPGRRVPGRKAFTLAMVNALMDWPDIEYLGVIGYAEGSKPAQPMWVWRKL